MLKRRSINLVCGSFFFLLDIVIEKTAIKRYKTGASLSERWLCVTKTSRRRMPVTASGRIRVYVGVCEREAAVQ